MINSALNSNTDLLSLLQFQNQIVDNVVTYNLGYLGISVAILGVLGGVFVYFNIKPLKDTLEKQEVKIEELKKEAQGLLVLSAEQSEKALEDFQANQSKTLSLVLEKQEEKMRLETENRIQTIEKILSEKIENISEAKDLKLKEILLSEVTNRLAVLGKELTSNTVSLKEEVTKEVSQVRSVIGSLKAADKEFDEEIKELQVYKHSKEGQMGAIIISIKLLKIAVDDYLEIKKSFGKSFKINDEETFSWKVKNRLQELTKEIGDSKLEQKEVLEISTELKRVENETTLITFISSLRAKLGI